MEYKDYIICFSTRAKKVLEKFSECDPKNELNVTALLSVATSAFLIPFERLKDTHPFGDRSSFETIASRVDAENKKKFENSELFTGTSWLLLKKSASNQLTNENFEDYKYEAIGTEKTTEEIISIIRNALAHGNIKTGVTGDTIEKLYFASRNNAKGCDDIALEELKTEKELTTKKMQSIIRKMQTCKEQKATFKILQCSVEDFKSFVHNWIDLLTQNQEILEKDC